MANASGTLRLLLPQWQGGNNPAELCGDGMLSWLSPEQADPTDRVKVEKPTDRPLMCASAGPSDMPGAGWV